MSQVRIRFTVRGLIVATAIAGMDLWGLISTIKAWPRETAGIGMAGGDYVYYSDGSVVLHQPLKPGSHPILVRPASASGVARVWCPIAISAVITVLAVGLAFGCSARRHGPCRS